LPFFGSLGAISRQKGLFVIPNKRTYSLFQTGGLIRYSIEHRSRKAEQRWQHSSVVQNSCYRAAIFAGWG
jgi:hypothetical protein